MASFPRTGDNRPEVFLHLEMADRSEDDARLAILIPVEVPEETVVHVTVQTGACLGLVRME